ncbi:ScpA family protein [Methanoregula sp.]|uniref:ScpA family protein n=1 Tax=Methanoregula sp. TaxID=2052170 RepID=UPI002C77A929|nr:ScpA family protein [Methanoregula sp.]HVP97537.1 ScpA family protein [Methanoregula sp.]
MAEPKKNRRRANPAPKGDAVTGSYEDTVQESVQPGTVPGDIAPSAVLPEPQVPSDSPASGDAPAAPEPPGVEDPVEILVGLAERGEIDPWNINIIEVTDRFLTELEKCRQLNLQISGRTLFYAATLLRMKSELLDIAPDEDEDTGEGGEDFDLGEGLDFEDEGRFGPIERLEREIQRRLDRKSLRKSPVTLFELIIELKNLEKEERRRRRLPPVDEDYLIEADDVVGIAHEEGYQDSARQVIEECLANADPATEITLVELCRDLGWGLPEVYIPLLFLALDGQCALRQEEFFGDIYVHVVRADEQP